MARPKKDIKSLKAIIVSFRIAIDEYLIMAHNTESMGITVPEYIRRKVTGKALPRTRVTPYDRKLFVELGRIGNNLNQLTKKAHLGMHDPQNLHAQLLELKNILDALKSNILNNDSKAD